MDNTAANKDDAADATQSVPQDDVGREVHVDNTVKEESAADQTPADTAMEEVRDDQSMASLSESRPRETSEVSSPSVPPTPSSVPPLEPAPVKPVVSIPPKRRPRRTGQPLHLLLQDCSRQHITGYLCKKTAEEIGEILTDKHKLATDLQLYSNDFVLDSARDRVIGEVDAQGKELLADVSPERDVIKARFADESSVFKSYDDAIHDVRVDLFFQDSKPKAGAAGSTDSNAQLGALKEELALVLKEWDKLYKRDEVDTRRAGRLNAGPSYHKSTRPTGPPPSGRSHPYAPSHRGPPASFAGPYGPPPPGGPYRDSRDSRDYRDRPPPPRDDYYDRRDDYRRDHSRRSDSRGDPRGSPLPMGGPPPMAGRPDMRDMRGDPRDYRDRMPPKAGDPYRGGAFDRPRDHYDSLPIPPSQPPPPARGRGQYDQRGPSGGAPLAGHPSLPPKPPVSIYEAVAHSHQQQHGPPPQYPQHSQQGPPQSRPPHQPPHMAPSQPPPVPYGGYNPTAPPPVSGPPVPGYPQQPQGYPGATEYGAYGYPYGQDPNAAAAHQPYGYAATGAPGWDMSAMHQTNGLLLQPFASAQPGRHKSVPLPTDFMSGPSDAPRLSMPEPHEVLGVIRGVIIRDAQGNIGLSQYQFSQSS